MVKIRRSGVRVSEINRRVLRWDSRADWLNACEHGLFLIGLRCLLLLIWWLLDVIIHVEWVVREHVLFV